MTPSTIYPGFAPVRTDGYIKFSLPKRGCNRETGVLSRLPSANGGGGSS